MADRPMTPEEARLIESTDNFADTMFCKMALTLVFSELAKFQNGDEKASEFLAKQKETLRKLGHDLFDGSVVMDDEARDRFDQNLEVVFGPISIGGGK